jgi:hypothetical protein
MMPQVLDEKTFRWRASDSEHGRFLWNRKLPVVLRPVVAGTFIVGLSLLLNLLTTDAGASGGELKLVLAVAIPSFALFFGWLFHELWGKDKKVRELEEALHKGAQRFALLSTDRDATILAAAHAERKRAASSVTSPSKRAKGAKESSLRARDKKGHYIKEVK